MSDTSKRIYLSPPHMSGDEEKYVGDAFKSNWIAPLGPHVDAFEEEMAERVGAGGAVALVSGTAAIHLALMLLGVGRGDRVFCSTFSFVASINPALYLGASPVFIDSEPGSWNMSPRALQEALEDGGPLPKAVVVVNLYGQSAHMEPILSLCENHGVPVVEDAAESLGATYRGKASGTLGAFGIYSFNGNKIITTSGGGMLVSNDVPALEKARFLASQARDPAPHYQHSQVGYNYRMSNLLAAVGRAQLNHLEDRIARRREIFWRYHQALSPYPGIAFMPEASFGRSTRWLTVITLDPEACGVTPECVMEALEQENVEARKVWKPLHRQPLFQDVPYYPHGEGVSDGLFARGLCLPSGSSLTGEDQERVIARICHLLEKRRTSR